MVYYVKPKYDENTKLCYIDVDSLIVYVKTEYIYKDIAEDVETRSVTSNFEATKVLGLILGVKLPLPLYKNYARILKFGT